MSFKDKSIGMQNFIDNFTVNEMGGIPVLRAQELQLCAVCKQSITQFKDRLSEKEYSISGMCQKCQDDVFEGAEDEI